MDLIELGNRFFQNPTNVWIGYLIAAFFAVDAIVLRWLGRRMVKKTNEAAATAASTANQAVASNGDGDEKPAQARRTAQVLGIAANFSTVLAAIIFALAYFNS